jgi:alpha-galactosidase
MGRTTGDIACKYSGGSKFDEKPKRHYSVMDIAEKNNAVAEHAGNGYWNDPDMLVTGDQGLTSEEQKVHFALWCIMSSPLMIGSDPISMGKEELALLTNKTAIEINQDPTEQGTRIIQDGTAEVWAKQLKGGKVTVLLLNRDKTNAQSITLDFEKIGLPGEQAVLDVYAGKALGKSAGTITKQVPPSAGLFLLIGE